MLNQEPVGKMYYSLEEVKEMTLLPASTLHYWERHFEQFNPRKDGHGNRYYTMQEIELFLQIKFIRDELKITRIEAIRAELANGSRKADVRQRATAILEKVKNELIEIKALI